MSDLGRGSHRVRPYCQDSSWPESSHPTRTIDIVVATPLAPTNAPQCPLGGSLVPLLACLGRVGPDEPRAPPADQLLHHRGLLPGQLRPAGGQREDQRLADEQVVRDLGLYDHAAPGPPAGRTRSLSPRRAGARTPAAQSRAQAIPAGRPPKGSAGPRATQWPAPDRRIPVMAAAAAHLRSRRSGWPCDGGSRRRPRARRRCRARGCAVPAPGVRCGGCPRARWFRRGRPRSAASPPRPAWPLRATPRSATRRSRPGSSCGSRRPPSSLRRPGPGGSSAADRGVRPDGQPARGGTPHRLLADDGRPVCPVA